MRHVNSMNNKSLKYFAATIFVFSISLVTVFLPMWKAFAHTDNTSISQENSESISVDHHFFKKLTIQVAVIAVMMLLALVVIAILYGETARDKIKKSIFVSMVLVIVLPTIFFVNATVYINLSSVTKGPVHWHADFKIIACGQEMKRPRPKGILSNKTGTNVLHEHEDRRIHIEGVVVKESDVSLEKFFAAQGGELTATRFAIPTDEGIIRYNNGDHCKDTGPGSWQVFLYTTDNGLARQQKLDDFVHYVPSHFTNVPPGDCIIFEFGPEKERTDAICDFYQLEIHRGNLTIF